MLAILMKKLEIAALEFDEGDDVRWCGRWFLGVKGKETRVVCEVVLSCHKISGSAPVFLDQYRGLSETGLGILCHGFAHSL